jgi:hypothetical protein
VLGILDRRKLVQAGIRERGVRMMTGPIGADPDQVEARDRAKIPAEK